MTANRHTRRVQAARTRRKHGTAAAPRSLKSRVALGIGGLAAVTLAVLFLANPRGAHTARGLYFLLVLGGVCLVLALKPS